MTLSMCTQLLWSIMARPVLSGTCPVKRLYSLGHHASAQFQGLGDLPYSLRHLYVEKQLFFSDTLFFLFWSGHRACLVNGWRFWVEDNGGASEDTGIFNLIYFLCTSASPKAEKKKRAENPFGPHSLAA